MEFRGKVVVITGSSKGIGREIALEFSNKGAVVVVNGRNRAEVQKVEDEISNNGGISLGIAADVTKKTEVENLFRSVIDKYGKVDILINNAGGDSGSKTVEDLTEEEWDSVINRNLKSVFLCSKAVIKNFKRQKQGRIINIASQAGRAISILGGPHYAAAKAGVIGFTKHLARELVHYGVTVNSIAPGIVISGEKLKDEWNSHTEEEQNKILEDIPLKRLGTNAEIAKAVLFLASEDSSYIVGACLDVNGGRWML
ncbi:SDR family NAD(P)-dependent oxidoreductase [Clostridium luticellarii]|jgi:3-oxoacyl-[acyl-carrier protein] reductase|uniref:3-oxoacyl-[acyl-carrier-protein] reductase FabG n=1 Tax=Clostridium luticellarii TaxID=1691940 RepID=A0A2T0BPI2_9CLOT|nr:SDR family NAD(P)-dependent oxidoreductase [Clostridium luticellarii]MCI1945366.1 SDR family oxidoreductase [Clostridium luticellarii]MCI1968669.1 SDR family oxidoreductase [Clostridium luticellarii]MCI1996805.1 SDR family oxidoreductase [Clostridium luticellarii]MCI2040415.1 SDR family oxidoreductase [Clostridium luticellarii]PRR85791.1 3-oxoacyl-[acyl-carrier-protein] reductase FabG [Clostridium luticellarii]